MLIVRCLEQGDIGTVVLIHQGGKGYEVEFVTLDGETVAIFKDWVRKNEPVRILFA